MRGQIEVLIHELTEAQKRQRDLYVDLDSRMRKLETACAGGRRPGRCRRGRRAGAGACRRTRRRPRPVPAGDAAGAPGGAGANLAAEQRAYDGALDQFKRGDYPGAIAGFGAFVKTYPKSALAPSAQYWIGNAQFARRDYRGAIAAQRAVAGDLSGQRQGARRAAQHRLGAVRARRGRGGAAHARGTGREIPAVGGRRQGEAAPERALAPRRLRRLSRMPGKRRPDLRRAPRALAARARPPRPALAEHARSLPHLAVRDHAAADAGRRR